MNSLLETFAYGMATKQQINEFQYGKKMNKSVRRSPLKDLTPVFVITEDDLP
jgi:hypothetical protein